MLPNIDLRIANMIKALEQVILPALPSEQRLARDQALLVSGHLRMLAGQWKSALRYEQVSLDDLSALAEVLLSDAPTPLGERLETALAEAKACDRACITALESVNIVLGRAVDTAILGGQDHLPLSQNAIDAVLGYSQRHARRERTWFQANNLDPDREALPAIDAMLAEAG